MHFLAHQFLQPLPAVVQYLAKHSNITDLTDELSRSGITSYAIARGGYSDVYRATRSDGTILAIKCLRQHDAKHVKHTARELNTWSKLKHENILELYGLALFQGCLAMVSPWMKFGSVGSVVKKWPDMDRYKLCYQLALVVDYLHQENVVHGDIKGDNVLVAEDGTLKLTDFGLAILHDEVLRFSQTDPGGGTCRWMAPELYKDDAQRCRETDVYAMGMTMLEIITGDIPFREIRSGHSVVLAVVHEKRTPEVPELQQEPVLPRAAIMYQVLKWCWGYTPSERPTASQVVSVAS
ncbi:hypothetical protein FRC08_002979 [Ceratobasidium sp. 394]|nr:hypothetical protein FRC08_002979 [Ceratobasidium sp. 394]